MYVTFLGPFSRSTNISLFPLCNKSNIHYAKGARARFHRKLRLVTSFVQIFIGWQSVMPQYKSLWWCWHFILKDESCCFVKNWAWAIFSFVWLELHERRFFNMASIAYLASSINMSRWVTYGHCTHNFSVVQGVDLAGVSRDTRTFKCIRWEGNRLHLSVRAYVKRISTAKKGNKQKSRNCVTYKVIVLSLYKHKSNFK